MQAQTLKSGLLFWLHVFAVIATWLIPFLISWKIALFVYAAVMIQFAIWGKCLMNAHHGLDESDGRIFYTELLEHLGFRPNPKWVKITVRQWLYPALGLVSILWQAVLGNAPLWPG